MNFSAIFKKTDMPIGRASNWIGVITFLVAIVGAISWPTSTLESISRFGWGAIVIFSLLLSCLILISTSVFLLSYRKFRPLESSQAVAGMLTKFSESPENSSDREAQNQEIQEVFEGKILQLRENNSKKFREVADTLKYLEVMIVNSQEKTAELRDDVRSAFSAQRTHGIYLSLAEDIDRLIVELSDPADTPDQFPNWQTWLAHYDRFKSQLNHLTRLVENYIDVREAVFHVPPEKFKSQYWKFNETGLSDDQKHDYKTFRIIAANYKDKNLKINSSLIDAIYRNP